MMHFTSFACFNHYCGLCPLSNFYKMVMDCAASHESAYRNSVFINSSITKHYESSAFIYCFFRNPAYIINFFVQVVFFTVGDINNLASVIQIIKVFKCIHGSICEDWVLNKYSVRMLLRRL